MSFNESCSHLFSASYRRPTATSTARRVSFCPLTHGLPIEYAENIPPNPLLRRKKRILPCCQAQHGRTIFFCLPTWRGMQRTSQPPAEKLAGFPWWIGPHSRLTPPSDTPFLPAHPPAASRCGRHARVVAVRICSVCACCAYKSNVCRRDLSTSVIGSVTMTRSIATSAIVARLSVITTESVSKPECCPSGVDRRTRIRLG